MYEGVSVIVFMLGDMFGVEVDVCFKFKSIVVWVGIFCLLVLMIC